MRILKTLDRGGNIIDITIAQKIRNKYRLNCNRYDAKRDAEKNRGRIVNEDADISVYKFTDESTLFIYPDCVDAEVFEGLPQGLLDFMHNKNNEME